MLFRSRHPAFLLAICLLAPLGCSESDGVGNEPGVGGTPAGTGATTGASGGGATGASGSGSAMGGTPPKGGAAGAAGMPATVGGASGTSSAGATATGGTAMGGTAMGGTAGASTSGAGGSGAGGSGAGGSGAGGSGAGGASAGGGGTGGGGNPAGASWKPRVIQTTDLLADKDDEQSLVRQLVYANVFDLEGLVPTTGCWRKKQDQSGMAKLQAILDAYGKALPNLKVHDPAFPSLEYLRSISVMGQTGYSMGDVGAGKDSPGSDLIIKSADKADPRPLWVTCWGGCNTIAQAIWKVKNSRSDAELRAFLRKLRVYDVLGQDEAAAWMAHEYPDDLFIIRAGDLVYKWQPSDGWVNDNVQSHGPLGGVYPEKAWAYEGDTPAVLHLIPNGLHDPSKAAHGGWGGRFGPNEACGVAAMDPVKGQGAYNPYCFFADASEGGPRSIGRWKSAIENDFAARMDWSITASYAGANHSPVAVLNGDKTLNVLEVSGAPGASVMLSAAGSTDPDSDALSYSWYFYDEPSTYDESVSIAGSSSPSATVSVPGGAAGKSIHVILEVRDDGAPALVAYRRTIINVK